MLGVLFWLFGMEIYINFFGLNFFEGKKKFYIFFLEYYNFFISYYYYYLVLL